MSQLRSQIFPLVFDCPRWLEHSERKLLFCGTPPPVKRVNAGLACAATRDAAKLCRLEQDLIQDYRGQLMVSLVCALTFLPGS